MVTYTASLIIPLYVFKRKNQYISETNIVAGKRVGKRWEEHEILVNELFKNKLSYSY